MNFLIFFISIIIVYLFNYFYSYEIVVMLSLQSIPPGVLHLYRVIIICRSAWLTWWHGNGGANYKFVRHKTWWWWYNLQFKIESFTRGMMACSDPRCNCCSAVAAVFNSRCAVVGKEKATPSFVYYTRRRYLFIFGYSLFYRGRVQMSIKNTANLILQNIVLVRPNSV